MAYMNILKFNSCQLPPINSRVVLSSPEKTSYSSGEKITGEVFFGCQKDIYSFGIKVALEGRAMVKFKDQGGQSKSVILLETFTYVYGKGDQRIRLPPGDHVFPFTLDLPNLSSIPGSFRSPFGLILYQVILYVQLEWKLVRKSEKTLNISSYLNLSEDVDLSNAVSYEKTEKCLLPSLLSRRLTPQFRFNFRMTQSGFLVEDEIPFELELDNPSTYEISSLAVSLIQKITYSAGTASKVKQKVIARLETGDMDSPNRTLWTEAIVLPQETLPSQKGIIEIVYSIKIEVIPVGHHTLKGDVPVTIGTTRDSVVPSSDVLKGGELSIEIQSTKVRERSTLHGSLSGSKSGRGYHKSLDRLRADSARSTHPCPPRYSVLSIRSSSLETLPPTYEDVVKEDSSPETAEFKKFSEEEEQDGEGNEYNEEEEVEPVDTLNQVDAAEVSDKLMPEETTPKL